ncbi:MAG: GNAT family N-acetyltransferase [Acidimicrobiia bacterium]|nr:MAG: GNAT family N-acetyltransferase [Acidimicrobiia bacterium]
MRTLEDIWPFFGIRLRTPRLELRLLIEDEMVELVDLAARGIHDPAWMPFGMPWTDLPPGEFEREALRFHWKGRAAWRPEQWSLNFGVFADDSLIGAQDVAAKDFGVLRTVETGSWLGRDHQGKGFGKEMRAAVLAFAFEGLGATLAVSGAWHDNPASQGVSRALGYEEDGWTLMKRRDQADRHDRFRLSRERWAANQYCTVDLVGVDPCLELLGAG